MAVEVTVPSLSGGPGVTTIEIPSGTWINTSNGVLAVGNRQTKAVKDADDKDVDVEISVTVALFSSWLHAKVVPQ